MSPRRRSMGRASQRRGDGDVVAFGQGAMLGTLAVDYVLARRRKGQISTLTATNHRSHLTDFVRVVGDRPVVRLHRRHVERWLETLGRLAPATRRARVSTVRGFSSHLYSEGYVDRYLMEGVPTPKEPRRSPRGVQRPAIQRLLTACPDARGRLVVVWMLQLGLRCSEVARVEIGDIDRWDRSVHVVGKGQHERTVRLTDEAAIVLDEYLAEQPASAGPLVRSYRRGHMPLTADTISGLVSRWMREAGIKRRALDGISAHALRHQCAGDLLRGGASTRDVQQVLGHAHLSTTERYLPTMVGTMAEVMEGRWYRFNPVSTDEQDVG
jgi:site-specific recombinase XerD